MLSFTTYFTNSDVMKIPITGNTKYHQLYVLVVKLDVSSSCISFIMK